MPAIDWSKIYKKYKGKWVALLDDEITVVGSGKTLKAARDAAQKKGHKNPIMTRMPDRLITFVGTHEVSL